MSRRDRYINLNQLAQGKDTLDLTLDGRKQRAQSGAQSKRIIV
jgi:hypothetical protein